MVLCVAHELHFSPSAKRYRHPCFIGEVIIPPKTSFKSRKKRIFWLDGMGYGGKKRRLRGDLGGFRQSSEGRRRDEKKFFLSPSACRVQKMTSSARKCKESDADARKAMRPHRRQTQGRKRRKMTVFCSMSVLMRSQMPGRITFSGRCQVELEGRTWALHAAPYSRHLIYTYIASIQRLHTSKVFYKSPSTIFPYQVFVFGPCGYTGIYRVSDGVQHPVRRCLDSCPFADFPNTISARRHA